MADLLRITRPIWLGLGGRFRRNAQMLEAMAAGCLIVGSRTPPVEEVIRHGENGLLADFFSPQEIAERVVEALEDPRAYAALRQAARQTIVQYYDLKTICLPAHLRLLNLFLSKPQQPRKEATYTNSAAQEDSAPYPR